MRHPTQLHSGGVDWPKVRILVYSLDDAFRFLTRQTFRKLNVRDVLSTSVAADATPLMSQAPDIALVDVDGDSALALAFLQRVRAADADMPVLMVAKANDRALVAPALPLGIEGFLPKPVSGHELSHRVGDSLVAPRRVPMPAAPVQRTLVLDKQPQGQAAAGAAEAAAVKAQLAAATARLGQAAGGNQASPSGGSAGGGTAGGGGMRPNGGSYGDGGPAAGAGGAKPGGGSYGDDGPATGGGGTKPGGGSYGDDGPAAAGGGAKPGGGSYGDDGPAAGGGGAKGDGGAYGDDALPEALRAKRKTGEEAARQQAERERWEAELAARGHKKRKGGDVAGLDVEAIVAAHVSWLATQGAEGKRADFKKMDLAGAALAGSVLANAGFREADLSDAQLAEARLDGADLRYASLSAADLASANLGVAQLRHCDLRLANLQGASLRGADLSGARLRGAKLAGADFKGAVLVGSDLSEADLSKVDNLTQGQVEKAIFDAKTKLPPGVSRPRADRE